MARLSLFRFRRARRHQASGTVALLGDDSEELDRCCVRLWQEGWELVAEHFVFVLRASADATKPRLVLYDGRGTVYADRLIDYPLSAGDTVGADWRLIFTPDLREARRREWTPSGYPCHPWERRAILPEMEPPAAGKTVAGLTRADPPVAAPLETRWIKRGQAQARAQRSRPR